MTQKFPPSIFFKIEENGIQIISDSKRYIDHYKKVDKEYLSNDFLMSEISIRKPIHEEAQSLDFEYQAGMELMFWLSKLQANELTKEITLNSLEKAIDSLNQTPEYPIAKYNSVWHATFGLAIVFAEQLRYEHKWEWVMTEKGGDRTDVGWTLISSDKKYAINIEQVFYKKVMSKKHIDITGFYDYIETQINQNETREGYIEFIELPCD